MNAIEAKRQAIQRRLELALQVVDDTEQLVGADDCWNIRKSACVLRGSPGSPGEPGGPRMRLPELTCLRCSPMFSHVCKIM